MREWLGEKIGSLPRWEKRLILLAFDFIALLGVLWLSYSMRLGTTFTPSAVQLGLMALAPVIAIPIFIRLGLYRAVIRYLPDRAIWTIVMAMTAATLVWVAVLFLTEMSGIGGVPRSVPVLYWLFGTLVVAGGRFAAKRLLWTPVQSRLTAGQVLVYGAGEAGTQLANALRTQNARFVAGFLDDDPELQGRDVMGVRVYPPARLGELVENFGIREVIVSMPSITATERNAIVDKLRHHKVKIRTLPSITDLAAGKYLVGHIREIDIDDLLGRSSVPADPDLLREMVEDRAILVSGAGGSIGSELARLIVKLRPRLLLLLEANEFALYEIDRQLRRRFEGEIVPVLGSVGDAALVRRTLATHAVDAVFHAAAHKHVPLVEANVFEGVRNNVFGTLTIVGEAAKTGISNFVLISSDKAVHPTNVMGATKRWAELIVRHYGEAAQAEGQAVRFCSVRFGNVLGSNGSVVPLFKEQIAAGGPITLTDPRMTRYFMSIHEAAELIVQAGALSEGGDIFLLDMGNPILIKDLAEQMVRLANLELRDKDNPDGDIEIVVSGARPGEKLCEELFYDPNRAQPTRHPKILRAKRNGTPRDIERALTDLQSALEIEDEAAVRAILYDFIA